jgi:LPS export ABC transporter protein LptC
MRSSAQRRHVLTQRLVALAAAAAALALLYGLFGPEPPDLEKGAAPPQKGYYLIDSTMTEIGPNGRPKMIVHARQAVQQLSDQSVDATDITLESPTDKYGTWHGTALRGHLTPDRNTIQLAGDVTMTSQLEQGVAVIHTEHLDYDIDGNLITTSDPVDVRLGNHVLKARGLRADMNAQTLKLESGVNGRFTP